MKKIFMFLAVIGVMAFTAQYAAAQDQAAAEDTTATEAAAPAAGEAGSLADLVAATQQDVPLHQQLKTQFIDGGPGFMSLIVLCLILGLAVCIERIIYLSLSKTNTKKLLAKIEEALNNGGLEAAKEVCRNTRGPVASIFYQGLYRILWFCTDEPHGERAFMDRPLHLRRTFSRIPRNSRWYGAGIRCHPGCR